MKTKLLAVLNEFNALLPKVIGNTASVPDQIHEINALTIRAETIIREKYIQEPATYTELEPMMDDELLNVFFNCDYCLEECGAPSFYERIVGNWYPLHEGLFHHIADSIFHLRNFYWGIKDTGIQEAYQKN